jgi:hypothetical protein
MPTYTFYDDASGIEWDEFLSMSEKEKFLKKNKHIRQIIQPVAIVGDHVMGVGPKTDGGFNENMQRIAAAHPGSPLADKFGGSTQSHTEIKTRDAINKHRKTVERSGFSASKKKTL